MFREAKLVALLAASLAFLQTFDLARTQQHVEVSTQNIEEEETGLQPRTLNTIIPETNVIYWKELPQTGEGIRYQNCSVPVEDTRVFMDCVTEGGSEMSRSVCKCAVTNNTLYITCYKDDKWYPPIPGACVNEGEMTFNETSSASRCDLRPAVITLLALSSLARR